MFSSLCISGFLQFLQTAVFTVGYISGTQLFPEPLSSMEESMYLERLSTGDEEARNILIERNLRLVAHVCKKYSNSNVDQDDLISIGTIGLIKAIDTFNQEKGIRLATYASRCIENEILMFVRKHSSQKREISIDEPLSVDWDGNELLLSDILTVEENPIDKKAKRIKCRFFQNINKVGTFILSLAK